MRRVLIADDDAGYRLFLRDLLRRSERYAPVLEEAQTGAQALTIAQRHEPDAIVMDARMPVLGGLGAARMLRDHSVTCPIVIVTGYATELPAWLTRDAGVSAVLAKLPDLSDTLLETLDGLT